MRHTFHKIAMLALLALCSLAPASVAIAETKLFVRSQYYAGVVGDGAYTFTSANGPFSVGGSVVGDSLSIQAANYQLLLAVPVGQAITLGDYEVPWQDTASSASRISMNFLPNSDPGYCTRVSGRFHVLELVRDAQGTVNSLAVNFEQRCNDFTGMVFGQLRFNSALSTDTGWRIPDPLIFPPVINALPGAMYVSASVTVYGLDTPIPLTISQGEVSVNGAAFTSAPGSVKYGDAIRVRLTAPATGNSVATAVLNFNGYLTTFAVGTPPGPTPQPAAGGLIVIYGQPKYGLTTPKTSVLGRVTAQEMRLTKSTSNSADERGIRAEVRQIESGPFTYALELYGPAGATIAPGSYRIAGSNPSSGQSALIHSPYNTTTFNDIASCEYGYGQGTSDVVVREIEYGSDGRPIRLAMDFVTTCTANYSAYSRVYGHVRINSTAPIDYALRLPIPFEFPGVVDAAASTVFVSATGAATGITEAVPVTISGGEYSIGSGAFTSAPGVINNGETICVRLTSAATPNTERVAMLTMGGVEFPFNVGTATGTAPQPTTAPLLVLVSVPRDETLDVQTRVYSPATLDPFVVAKQSYSGAFDVTVRPTQNYAQRWSATFSGAAGTQLMTGDYPEASSYYSSALPSLLFTYNGGDCYPAPDPAIRMKVTEIEYANDGTPTKLAADFVLKCASNSTMVTQYGHLRINSALPIDYAIDMPAPFTFVAQTGLALGATVISNEVTMRAMNVPLPISIVGGEYSINGSSYTTAPATIAPGQKLRLRATASSQNNTARIILVTVGGRTETFTVATTPNANPQPNGVPLAVFYSQDFATGLLTQLVASPATLVDVSLSPSTYSDARTIVRLDTMPAVPGIYPWQLVLAGPGESLLQTGSYTCNGGNSSATGARCSASAPYGNYTPLHVPACYTSMGAGSPRPSHFIVHEIEHSVTGETLRLALDFVDNCVTGNEVPTAGTAAVFAFIRINSSFPIDHIVRQPMPFYFAPASGVLPSALVQSGELIVRSINVPVPIGIAGGEYSIDGGAYTTAGGSISAGQPVRVRVAASALANTVTTANLTIGGVSGEFRVGTAAGFPPVANGNPLVYLISQGGEPIGGGATYAFSPATNWDVAAVRNYDNVVTVGVQPLPATNYSTWAFNFGAPNNGALVPGTYTAPVYYGTSNGLATLRITSPLYYGCGTLGAGSQFTVHEVVYGGADIGSAMTKFAVDFVHYCAGYPDPIYGYIRFNSTVPINPIDDTVPAAFSFASLYGATRGTLATSAQVVISGFNHPLPISVSNGEYSLDGAAFTNVPGIINSGQSVRVRTTAAAEFSTGVVATLTVGSRPASFTVYSEYANSYPNEITFLAVPNAPRSALVTSGIVTISGINVFATINSIQGGEVSAGGRPFTNMPTTIQPGETLQMRLVTGALYNTTHAMTAYVGGRYTVFSVQTLSQGVLQVTVAGNGRVDIAPIGAICTAFCSNLYDNGSQLTLTAVPGAGSAFTGWTGAGCAGTGMCSISLAFTAQVTATFAAQPPGAPTLVQVAPGNGRATLVFTPSGAAATAYAATCMPGGVTVTAAASPIVVTGLMNDTQYQCSVTASNVVGNSNASNIVAVTPSATVSVMLVGVVSRKAHGPAGNFDLPIDHMLLFSGVPTIEPRTNSGGHKIVFTFNDLVTSGDTAIVDGLDVGIPGVSVSTSIAGNELIANVSGLPDNIRVFARATQVNGTLDVSAPVGFLLGDVNGSGHITAADVAAVKARSGAGMARIDTYLSDINLSGQINATDVSQAKAGAGRSLP